MTEKIPLPARNFHAGGATFRLIAIDAGKTADLVLAGLIAGFRASARSRRVMTVTEKS